MQEIIKIEDHLVEGEKIQMVNARDLWEKLEVKSKFADWAKNKVYQAQLIEGQDYITVSKNLETGGYIKEYYLSIDSAKHIAMLEGNDKGRQIRQYFIDVEKQAKKAFAGEHPLVRYARETLEIAQKYASLEEEQRKMAIIQAGQAQEICTLQAKTAAVLGQSGYYSILAYANLNGKKVTLQEAGRFGKEATRLSQITNTSIGKIPDPRFGEVHTYHIDILKSVFGDN